MYKDLHIFTDKGGFRLSEEEIPKKGMERKGLEKKTNGDEGLNLNSPLQPMKRNGVKMWNGSGAGLNLRLELNNSRIQVRLPPFVFVVMHFHLIV